jgi:hypothetical protein
MASMELLIDRVNSPSANISKISSNIFTTIRKSLSVEHILDLVLVGLMIYLDRYAIDDLLPGSVLSSYACEELKRWNLQL